MSKKTKIMLLLISTFIVFCFGFKIYLDKTYLNQFDRESIIGEDRYESMVKISNKGWKKSKEAVLINTRSITDGISASPFAYAKDIPMFFTEEDTLNSTIKDELKRLGVEKVYLVGGVNTINKKVENQLKKINIDSERIAGNNGFETSLLFAKALVDITDVSELALVNSDRGIPNGVSIASSAAKNNMPVVMMSKKNEHRVIEFVKNNDIENVYIIGNEDQVSKYLEHKMPSAKRINGEDRFDTNKKIIQEFYETSKIDNVYITKGGIYTQADFLNTLSIGIVAAKEDTPVVLSEEYMNKDLLTFLEDLDIDKISEIGFEFNRPKIINENSIRVGVNIVIIILAIFALKRVIYL